MSLRRITPWLLTCALVLMPFTAALAAEDTDNPGPTDPELTEDVDGDGLEGLVLPGIQPGSMEADGNHAPQVHWVRVFIRFARMAGI